MKIIVKINPGESPKEVVMDVDYKINQSTDTAKVTEFGQRVLATLKTVTPGQS